jgi:hypothetical protein
VQAELELPVALREVRVPLSGTWEMTGVTPVDLSMLWTAAQVAATSLALGSYVTRARGKWRGDKLVLPEGTRLTRRWHRLSKTIAGAALRRSDEPVDL